MVVLLYLLAVLVDAVDLIDVGLVVVAISATNLVFATATVEVVAALLTGDIVRALEPPNLVGPSSALEVVGPAGARYLFCQRHPAKHQHP
jgi:hypothetical protein